MVTQHNSLMLSPSWNLPISFLEQADFWPEILYLMENSPNESVRKQIEFVWLDFMQALHWVYKTKWGVNKNHQIPGWDLMNKGEKNYIEAYGNYLLRLLEVVIAISSLSRFNAALFQGIESNFDDVFVFQMLCEEMLREHYNDAINNISLKTVFNDKYDKARDMIKCVENPYSAEESNNPFPNRPYFHLIHAIAIKLLDLDEGQIFKSQYHTYQKAYAKFVRTIKENKEVKCTFNNTKNKSARNKRVAYHENKSVKYA